MALSKQIHLFTVDTSAFYNEAEGKIHKKMNKRYLYQKKLNKLKKNNAYDEVRLNNSITNNKNKLKELKEKLKELLNLNKDIRVLDESVLNNKKIISTFDSSLTRVMNLVVNELTEDIFIVKTFYFKVIKDIIINGFYYKGEKYICLTASAGQIRTKKTVFIKESTLKKYGKTLMCGLTIEEINKQGGINRNKFLAYLALCNSATDKWEGFDINKTIVVDDMKTDVFGEVDFINEKTYEITRKKMNVPITHTDGCGMMLPTVSNKNFMIRMPWVKGLLVAFPFDKFIQENGCTGIVEDIYGVKHDVLKENIQVIFTKSQFKLYSYYKSWEDYKDKFIKYNCEAATCNVEPSYFQDAKLNYQMLQTLTDMTDDELKKITEKTRYNIYNLGTDRKAMLKALGLSKANEDKNNLQASIEKYPVLLKDAYTKEILKSTKKSLLTKAWSGKIDIDCKYTFVSPDLYAFCEYLFMGNMNPNGLLNDGEVFCKLYSKVNKLDCLRSPHLLREHSVNKNIVDEEKSNWFVTNAIYMSCKSLMSKLLQNDWDGDTLLVCAENTFVDVAERNMKDIVPLYYNMAKAGKGKINNESIFEGLQLAYANGNIGLPSNNISKEWNSEEPDLDVIKWLCMEVNFNVDYAKTLYKPERPAEINKRITDRIKVKLPHFFIYAKEKKKHQVEKANNTNVNKLRKIIKNKRLYFEDIDDKDIDYKVLMFHDDVNLESEAAQDVLRIYRKLDLKQHFLLSKEDGRYNNYYFTYQDIRSQILSVNPNMLYVTDVLVKYLFSKNSRFKTTLWWCFGDVVLENIKRNVEVKYIYCDVCGDIIEVSGRNNKYCDDCSKEMEKNFTKLRVKKYREKFKK